MLFVLRRLLAVLLSCTIMLAMISSATFTVPHAEASAGASPKGVSWGDPSRDWGNGTSSFNWTAITGDLDDMKNGGISWVRFEFEYDTPFSFYDQLLPLITQRGLQPLAIVSKNPPKDDLGDDASRQQFRDWMGQAVSRYKGSIRTWEIGNEPNLGGSSWKTPDPGTSGYADAAHRYVLHLQDAYTTIKPLQPDAVVMPGGISEWTMLPWIQELISQNAYQWMDAIAFHPYASDPNGIAGRITAFRQAIGAQSQLAAKPIWITEIGFHTGLSSNLPGSVPDEQTKATYLTQTITKLRESGITTPIFWYNLHEGRSATAGYGLVSKDPNTLATTYLPAYTAYKQLP